MSQPRTFMTSDGVRLAYRPVTEKIRPTRLGLVRRRDIRLRRMAAAFADFCREYLTTGGPMALKPGRRTAQLD